MEDAKKERAAYIKIQRDAVLMIRKKGELTSLLDRKYSVAEIKTRVKPNSNRKEDLIEAYLAAPKPKTIGVLRNIGVFACIVHRSSGECLTGKE